jgi:hypothetical protein
MFVYFLDFSAQKIGEPSYHYFKARTFIWIPKRKENSVHPADSCASSGLMFHRMYPQMHENEAPAKHAIAIVKTFE